MKQQKTELLRHHVRFGDGAGVAAQKHVHGEDALPIHEAQIDLGAVFIGLNVLRGIGQAAMQEVEDLGDAGGLGGR